MGMTGHPLTTLTSRVSWKTLTRALRVIHPAAMFSAWTALGEVFRRINCIEKAFRVNHWLSCTNDQELRMFMQVYFTPFELPFVA